MTGQPVADLIDLDEEMLRTLGDVHAERMTRTDDLLYAVLDMLANLMYTVERAPHFGQQTIKKLGQQRPPEPFPRPGQPVNRKKQGTTIGEFHKMLGEV